MSWRRSFLSWLVCLLVCSAPAFAKNGFDLSEAIVPVNEIKRGGPPRDGIFALTNPEYVPAEAVTFLQPDDRVLGIDVGGAVKAFPVRYLNVHEIVNDASGDQYFAVTYCPLCGTGIAFATNVSPDVHLNFGVSGLLYNSDLLMYDRNTESLWSQISGEAVAGRLVGTKLPRLPLAHTTWRDWQARQPDTLVMRGHPKFTRDYRRNPYPGYAKSRRLYFEVSHRAPADFHPKEMVLGIVIGTDVKAYPFSELERHGQASFSDRVGAHDVIVEWDLENQSAAARTADGETLVTTMGYWFAWYTFHPTTAVFRAPR